MFVTAHALTGAAIGRKCVRAPWMALVLAFASHFALDVIPHTDAHSLLSLNGRVTRPEALTAALDTAFALFAVILLTRGLKRRRFLIGAAFAATVIDLVDNVPPWGPWFHHSAATAWLSHFHHGIQHSVGGEQWLLGFGTQLLVCALAVWAIRTGRLSR